MNEGERLLIVALPLIILGVIAAIYGYLLSKDDEKKQGEWKVITKGIYDYAVYGEYDYTQTHRSGAMAHTTHTTHHVMKVTAVYFNDGRTAVLEGRHDMIFPKGTAIQVLENGLKERKIEKAE